MSSRILAAFFVLGASLLAGCTAAPEADDVDATRQAATAEATVTFKADWTTDVSGSLERGKRLRIVYAPSRTKCVATSGGNAVWSSTAFYRWNGGMFSGAAGRRAHPVRPSSGRTLRWGADRAPT